MDSLSPLHDGANPAVDRPSPLAPGTVRTAFTGTPSAWRGVAECASVAGRGSLLADFVQAGQIPGATARGEQ